MWDVLTSCLVFLFMFTELGRFLLWKFLWLVRSDRYWFSKLAYRLGFSTCIVHLLVSFPILALGSTPPSYGAEPSHCLEVS